jgi:hypothetical protein
MARVVYGESITELIGSIGGITFQRNASGPIARLKPKPPVNPSEGQSKQQHLLGTLVSHWPTLSSAEKTSWDDFAAAHNHFTPWGDEKTLNGFQWFVSCNLNLLLADEAIIDTAPAFASISPPDAFTLTADADSLNLIWASAFTVAPDYLFIYLTLPIRHSSLKLRRSMFLVKIDDTFNGTDLDITSEFEDLANVTWADFYSGSECNIIARIIVVESGTGLASQFTSSLVKIS